ncbi:response regulator transcription factor [Pseudooceanicola sp. LIPI14-2-Ac024]|uniref:response regulator transcription factor n=1 Tax=Pseudooceanicola sp. LIPI14-2-Ac024 TaxID=3344875 RepID=UPI0035D06EBD
MRILITDTTWNMATLAKMMRDQGFCVSEAANGEDVVAHVEHGIYDAVLIDPDLPDMEFTTLVRRLRGMAPQLPICLFDRDWTEKNRLRAYAAGADAVTGWPYQPDEIAAQMRAFARRARGFATQMPSFAGLTIDLDRRAVRFAGQSVHLTRLEYELIETLALANGTLVDRDTIMSRLYGWEDEPDPKIIDVYICRIRAKLATLDAPRALISTNFGNGYRLDPFANVVEVAAA